MKLWFTLLLVGGATAGGYMLGRRSIPAPSIKQQITEKLQQLSALPIALSFWRDSAGTKIYQWTEYKPLLIEGPSLEAILRSLSQPAAKAQFATANFVDDANGYPVYKGTTLKITA